MKFFIETIDDKQYLVLKDENGNEKSRSVLNPADPCVGCQHYVGACVGNCNLLC